MKAFVFKLQTSLDVKLKKEERQKIELGEATRVYKLNLQILHDLKDRMVEIQDVLRGKQTKKLNIFEIKNYQDYIPVLIEKIKKQIITTETSRQDMEDCRNKLVEIMRERKVLEKLKSKHFQEYMKELLREEQKQIDEMATNGYIHKDSAV